MSFPLQDYGSWQRLLSWVWHSWKSLSSKRHFLQHGTRCWLSIVSVVCPFMCLFCLFVAVLSKGSWREDDVSSINDTRKLSSDWLNEKKQSCCTCGTHLSTILWRSLSNDNVKFQNLTFLRQREHTKVNLSFSIFTSTALLLVHLQRALSIMKNARKKQ